MKTGNEFKQTVYGYWAKRFDREREEFTRPATLVLQEKELAETGKAHLYHIDKLSILRIDPGLAERAGLPEGYHPEMGALTVDTLRASLPAALASTFLDYFLDPKDFKCFSSPEGFTTRRLHAEQDNPQLRDLYVACPEEELDLADIDVEEPDPVMYGIFAGEQLVAYAGHRYWEDVIADMGVLIHPAYRGQGLGKAVVSALCDWCLKNDVVPMYRVFSYNVHSCRIAESLGFKALVVIETLEAKTSLNEEQQDSSPEKPWEVLRSEPGPDLILFQARYDWVRNPRNAKSMKAVILEAADWVNIVALTPEKKIVVVKQYRFGIKKTTTELPAGIMERDETPEQAAIRELKEETGYTAATWKYLGWVEANPAFMNNLCHQWLALDVVKTCPPDLDEGEEISVAEISLEEARAEIEQGNMRNSLTVLSLARVFDLRQAE